MEKYKGIGVAIFSYGEAALYTLDITPMLHTFTTETVCKSLLITSLKLMHVDVILISVLHNYVQPQRWLHAMVPEPTV